MHLRYRSTPPTTETFKPVLGILEGWDFICKLINQIKLITIIKANIRDNLQDSIKDNIKENIKDNFKDNFRAILRTNFRTTLKTIY